MFNQARLDSSLASVAATPPPAPEGLDYYPFQEAGVWNLSEQIDHLGAVMCADEQGLGKTIQAVGVANVKGFKRIMVVGPASLRLNWIRELEKWHVHNPGIQAVMPGVKNFRPDRALSLVTSYDLAWKLKKQYKPDYLIVDEAHHIKNPYAKRTQVVLGNAIEKWGGFVQDTPTIFLTGTPLPNGRPNEIWPLLRRCVPDVIDRLGNRAFIQKFCTYYDDGYGGVVVNGAKNTRELFLRLRGSGFMTRRLKKDVLKDLPAKRYKMVVFPANSKELRKALEKEDRFSIAEINENGGSSLGVSGLPEVRHEMGLAKVPQALTYLRDFLIGGTAKAVIFCHHLSVMAELAAGLGEYNPLLFNGSTSPKRRQEIVDSFQTDPARRVFIGNAAAAEGITLTAAQDVFIIEPEWVPGQNDQRVDRLHRIGQEGSVLVHYIVVENSLDAKILGASEKKQRDIENILTGSY